MACEIICLYLQTTIKMPFSAEPSKEARCVSHAMQRNGVFYRFVPDLVS